MINPTWNAYGPKGNLLASFGDKDLADRYREHRAAIGVEVKVKRVVQQRRAA